jgi:UDP-N-acetylglucosamine--N-acetylmuramyl-(pentapeptide) pyrophosphoryl-undecaprenol N-acetylglucosamine transferase
MTGGGTAGHITPLLAVAKEFKKSHPEAEIRYIGKMGDPMRSFIIGQGSVVKAYSILAGKWRRYHDVGFWEHLADISTIIKNIRDLFYFMFGLIQSLFILTIWRPNVIFIKGGFVGLPVGLAATLLRIPFVTHDSDSTPGLTNRILAKHAKLIAVALPVETYLTYYPSDKLRYTGVPIRDEFAPVSAISQSQAKAILGLSPDTKLVVIMGGSLGAMRLNEAVYINLESMLSDLEVNIFWISGKRQYQELSERLKQGSYDLNRVHLFSFVENFYNVVAAADVIVSRAGATTLAELAAAAKPVILVPNPYLTDNHQVKNAEILLQKDAAIVIPEQELLTKPDILINTLEQILNDETAMERLANNIQSLAVRDASKRIVDVIDDAMTK